MAELLLANLLLFGRSLRRAGLPVSLGQSMDFARALELVDVGDREQVYHAARSMLVTRRQDLRLFDDLFAHFFHRAGPAGPKKARRQSPRAERRRERPLDVVTYMAYKARRFDREIEVANKAGTWSRQEVLRRKDFSVLTPEELEAVKRLIQELRFDVSLSRTRRLIPDRRGRRADLHRTLRECAKHSVPLRLGWRSPKVKQRPVVLIADVSGSMEKYSRLVLQFFYSLTHSLRRVECFVFGTRLFRITPQLELRNVDRTLEKAARGVVDWAGGTRIADSLDEFNRRWSRRVLRRGAVAVLVSDGWERSDADRPVAPRGALSPAPLPSPDLAQPPVRQGGLRAAGGGHGGGPAPRRRPAADPQPRESRAARRPPAVAAITEVRNQVKLPGRCCLPPGRVVSATIAGHNGP